MAMPGASARQSPSSSPLRISSHRNGVCSLIRADRFLAALAVALLTLPVAVSHGDWINLTGAETAPNIAEITVMDDYVRVALEVYVGDLDVNAELVRRGAAWVYRKYARDESLYRLEDEARSARRGIWSLPEVQRMPPWEWRRGKRAAAAPVARSEPAAAGFECGSKTYCREMRSCQEALFHLNECGLARIDGDDDGMPCEKICR